MSACNNCGNDVNFTTYYRGKHLCDECVTEVKQKVVAN